MAQVSTYPDSDAKVSEIKQLHAEKAPQKELVGKVIGFSVFNIIFSGLFPGAWWVGLIGFFMVLGIIDEIVKFSKNPTRNTYPYHTTQDQLRGAWISFVIVRIIMSVLFHGAWFGEIAPTVLLINALEQSYIYYQMQEQAKRAPRNVAPVFVASIAPAPLAAEPTTEVVQPVTMVHFCSLCGAPREIGASFCSGCGTKF